MGFSKKVKEEIFVLSARHCCVCHKSAGLNIEVHHIKPKKQGGLDTLDNAIALCFDCHADAGHYFADHPKGSKLSPEELLKHKLAWFDIVKKNKIKAPKEALIELTVANENFSGIFEPIFIKEETRYIDRDSMKRIYELTGKDSMDIVNELKEKNDPFGAFYNPYLNKVNNYDELLDYLSNDDLILDDELTNTDCQPVSHELNMRTFRKYKEINKSNCVLKLRLKNISEEVIENYKLYLLFENVVEVDSVTKRREYLDSYEYSYNVFFDDNFKGEFIPDYEVLVQNDSVNIDDICFRTLSSTKNITIHWELFARNVSTKGKIELRIEPKFELSERDKYVKKEDLKDPTIRILPYYEYE